MQDNHNIDQNKKMKNARSMIIQKGDYYNDRQIRTLVLSTNVNDYDTGEPIVDGRTVREACVTELVRTQVNPDATIGQLVDIISNAVICLAHT
jgi:hypothetical protein